MLMSMKEKRGGREGDGWRKGDGGKGTEWSEKDMKGGLGELPTHHELLGPEVPRLQAHLVERLRSC